MSLSCFSGWAKSLCCTTPDGSWRAGLERLSVLMLSTAASSLGCRRSKNRAGSGWNWQTPTNCVVVSVQICLSGTEHATLLRHRGHLVYRGSCSIPSPFLHGARSSISWFSPSVLPFRAIVHLLPSPSDHVQQVEVYWQHVFRSIWFWLAYAGTTLSLLGYINKQRSRPQRCLVTQTSSFKRHCFPLEFSIVLTSSFKLHLRHGDAH